MLFCTVVKHEFQMAEIGLTDCTCTCGPHSVTGLDEPQQKVGVKIYVWTHDTDFRTARSSVLWHRCRLVSWSEGRILTNMNVKSFFLEHWDTRNCFLGICFKDVRECMSVAPPTEWVCIVLWLIPLFTGLIEFNTNTLDSIHLRILSINTKEQVMFLAFTGL